MSEHCQQVMYTVYENTHTRTYIFSLFSRDSLSGSVLFSGQAVNRHFQQSGRQVSKSAKLPKISRALNLRTRFFSTYAFAGSEVKQNKTKKGK